MLESKAWPFQEAKALLQRLNHQLPSKGYVLFETGYGPSGLPHIGTFGEVVRTTMVRKAFEQISGMPTRLWCISDDMDGMRKIPDTIPNAAEYKKYLDRPLTKVPDPFGRYESFGHNMNARLRAFLDSFGFEYEFKSATECYKSGIFNHMLLHVLEKYDDIMAIMLPTLGLERQQTYSPFLPVCQRTGKVLQVPIIDKDLNNGTISYRDPETNELIQTKVTDGFCKLQWKPDFGMRWAAFEVDFEMYGKDHLVNGKIYSAICKAIGGTPPHQMFYELFLDDQGQKISKSKGNGLTIDEWLRYAPQESLALFMYISPQKAKKLYFDVIPRCVDEYISHLRSFYIENDLSKKLLNPAFHIHNGNPPLIQTDISYSLILNLVNACNSENESVIWGYIKKFNSEASNCLFMQTMVKGAMNYYHDFIKPYKNYRLPTDKEILALHDLKLALTELNENYEETTKLPDLIQNKVYEIGKKHNIELKSWFTALYEILLGASSGPRFGSFVALYGIAETVELISHVQENLPSN